MDHSELLALYRRVNLTELWKIQGSVEDAVIRWESRVCDEPALRPRIREGYAILDTVQTAIQERLNVEVDQRN